MAIPGAASTAANTQDADPGNYASGDRILLKEKKSPMSCEKWMFHFLF